MQIAEARAFEGVRYERYVGGVIGDEGVEVEDREEKVLVGVCGVYFCRHELVVMGGETVCKILSSNVVREERGAQMFHGCLMKIKGQMLKNSRIKRQSKLL